MNSKKRERERERWMGISRKTQANGKFTFSNVNNSKLIRKNWEEKQNKNIVLAFIWQLGPIQKIIRQAYSRKFGGEFGKK